MGRRPRRWMCRLAGLALLAAVAAGLSVPTQAVLAAPEAETELETLRVARGDSLSLLLHRAGIEAVDIDRISRAIQKRTNLRRLRAGREVRLLFRVEGESQRIPVAVSVQTGSARFVEATRTAGGGYQARRTSIPLVRPVPLAEVAFERDGLTVTVRRNETIGGILYRHGVDGETVDAVVSALQTRFDPRGLMPGHAIEIVAGRDAKGAPTLQGVALHLDDDAAVAVIRTDGGGFAARRTTGTALRAARLAPESAPATAPAPASVAAPATVAEYDLPPQKPTLAEAETPAPATAQPATAQPITAEPEGEQQSAEAPASEPESEPAPESFALRYTLHAGSTLLDLLLDADVRRPEAVALVQSLRRVFNPRRLPAGITVRVTKRPVPGFEPRIARVEIELPQGRYIQVERGEKGRFSSLIMDEPPPPPAQPRAVAKAGQAERRDQAAAASTAPSEAERHDQAAAVSAPAPKPEPEPLPPSAELITMRSGDTLMAVLRRHGIDRVEADRAIQAARELINLRRLGIGQEITLVTGTDEKGADTLQTVALRVGKERFVKVSRTVGGRFEASRVDHLALSAAPLQLTATAHATLDGESGLDGTGRDSVNGYGDVMKGAFVSAAAPVTLALPVVEAGPPKKPVPAHGIVNGTANASVDDDDGLLRKAVVIRKGDTLSAALTRAGGTRAEAEAAIVAFRKVHNPRHLRIGQTLSLAFDPANESNGTPRLASFALDVAPNRDVVVTRGDDGIFLPSVVDRPLDRVLHRTVGAVDSSLYDAVLAAGMPIQTFMEMVYVFSYDVDFQREIQPGNRFEALYEAAYDLAGDFVENGPLLYARLEVGDRTIELFRYEPDEGPADYLDARGESVRKALMRTPINGARLSSGYGMRMHPILGYNKKHLGLDFAAPTGTPIFAAGDGTITRIGRAGNYGKYIRIRHNGTYSTGYAHLSGYAKGMKRGKRVRQGQVIGYVGSTGMSTGPHLHYEVMQGERRINPMKLKLPTGRKLKGAELTAFQQQVQKITILLAEVPTATRVARR